MSVIDEYLATITEPEHALLAHMYAVVRAALPDASEELSYNMPAFKQNGKGVIAILSNRKFLSVYPFCNLERLALDLNGYETTTGSIHFTIAKPLSDDLLRQIIAARMRQIPA